MIVDKIGKYRLLRDLYVSNSNSCGHISKGTIINVTQIDREGRKVIGPDLMDWKGWDLPVEQVSP